MILRALVWLCAVLLLAACSSGEDPGPTPTTEADAPTAAPEPLPEPPRPPRVGECHRLDLAAAAAPTVDTDPVPCRRRHTASTFRVGRLDLVDRGHRVAVDSPAVQAQPRRRCAKALPVHLGISAQELRLTMAQTVWFTPTVEDAAAGAAWFRCDLVVLSRPGRLAVLPRRTRGLGMTDSIAMCATSRPGSKGATRVTCNGDHSWRAAATVDLPGPRFPAPETVSNTMSDRCREVARARSSDPLDFDWSEERPTREQWRAGQHYGICWVPTRP